MAVSLLIDEQSHPLVLFAWMVKEFSHEWMEWPPSVIKSTLVKQFETTISRLNLEKIMATAAVATRDEFWTDWHHFHFLTQVLNNNFGDLQTVQEQTVGQMMVAVDIAVDIRRRLSPLVSMPDFDEDVARYVAAQALHQGVWHLPEPLGFAARYASGKWYKCRDCGTKAEVLFDDGLCDVCIERFDTSRLGSWEPNPKLIAKGWGKNIEFFYKNDPTKVEKRLQEALSKKIVLQENQVDICVARLLVALQYREMRKKQLLSGLEALSA